MDTAPEVERPAPLSFSPNDPSRLGRILSDALLFTSDDDKRPILYGVLVEVLDGGLVQLVSTNSYVLGWWRDDEGSLTPPTYAYGSGRDSVMPKPEPIVKGSFPATIYERDGLAEIAKMLSKMKPGSERVTITLTDEALTVDGGAWTLKARAYPAEYPQWNQLLPDLDAEIEAIPAPYIDVKWLALLGKLTLGRRVRKGETFALKYRHYGPLKPATIVGTAAGVEFVGLVMPTKV